MSPALELIDRVTRIRFVMGEAGLAWNFYEPPAIESMARDLTDRELLRAVVDGCPIAPLGPALRAYATRQRTRRPRGRPMNRKRDRLIRELVLWVAARAPSTVDEAIAFAALHLSLTEDAINRIVWPRNKSEFPTV